MLGKGEQVKGGVTEGGYKDRREERNKRKGGNSKLKKKRDSVE